MNVVFIKGVNIKILFDYLKNPYDGRSFKITPGWPCMVVSPDEANKYLNTVIVIPLTSTIRNYPTRIKCSFKDRLGQLVIDQIRAVDHKRLKNKLGVIDAETCKMLCQTLEKMFRY